MSDYDLTVPCGCRIEAHSTPRSLRQPYRYEVKPCALHGAAQDLLDACRAALNMPRRIVEQRLKSAIAKAEGRP
jgi:hypothetical protein